MDLIALLVVLIIVGLIFWVVHTLGGGFGIPAPIITVIDVVLVVLVVLYLIGLLTGHQYLRVR